MQSNFHPQTIEERLVFWTIAATWGFWLIGALYFVSPILGWTLASIAAWRYATNAQPLTPLPASGKIVVGVWVAAVAVMLVALLIGHANFALSFQQTLKSIVGWFKGWALLAVFICAGSLLRIRPQMIYRATNILALQTLVLVPVFFASSYLGVPKSLYVSPLFYLGGPGPEFFNVELYSFDPVAGTARWRFFAPWAPAAGMVAVISCIFATHDKNWFWKGIGVASAISVCVMSQSRLAIITLPMVILLAHLLANVTRVATFAALAILTLAIIPAVGPIMEVAQVAQEKFVKSRADSSFVRATLQSIAVHRWKTEAPVWGHGVVERGPHLVQYMPIGSHHTWNGLLFVKGLAGFLALAIALGTTIAVLTMHAQSNRLGRHALTISLILLFYSFGENLEILVYLFWPGLLIMGQALRHPIRNPWRRIPFCRKAEAPAGMFSGS